MARAGKKTAEAIRQEIAREVDQLLRVVFQDRRKTGRLDLEATEMAVRAALHRAGAAALSQLLQFPAPSEEQRSVPCPCGQPAHYHQLRTKPVLTAVGPVQVSRPYYWCPNCHAGQFPADVELDIENTEFSPGVRRMQALVGQEAPFDHGREQMKVLAGLEVTAKSVERTAEAIGADIAQREQGEIQKALQLDLPVIVGEPIPILYVQMDGTGVPVVKKETVGRQGKREGQPAHTREVKLGCVFTQTTWDREGYPMRAPDSTTYTGALETADGFGQRLYREAAGRSRRPSTRRRATAPARAGSGRASGGRPDRPQHNFSAKASRHTCPASLPAGWAPRPILRRSQWGGQSRPGRAGTSPRQAGAGRTPLECLVVIRLPAFVIAQGLSDGAPEVAAVDGHVMLVAVVADVFQ